MDRRNFFKAFCSTVAAAVSAPVVAMLPAAAKKQPVMLYSEVTMYKNGVECGHFQMNCGEMPFVYIPPEGYSGWTAGDVIGIKFDPTAGERIYI